MKSRERDELDLARSANAILLSVLEHPPAERQQLVERQCGDNPALRDLVESLLRGDDTVEGFLECPAVAVKDLSPPIAEDATPRRVGPFRILRPLGEGGVGAVFLARRDGADYEQRVALKLLRPGYGGEAVLRSLRTERRVLAGLEHPNIARLIEGGVSDEGVAYLALELVEGEPILEYCDRRRLGVRERIELFRIVCAAVHFAHRNLVLHRDLKPSNILVSRDGSPKLLDFGIAKLMEEADAATEATHTLARMLTPSHASPEHIAGRPLTASSDVYSLGVVLYRLLTGRLPHDLKGLAPQEMVERLASRPPVLPSLAVAEVATERSESTASAATIAAERSTDPGRLAKTLSGDLDVILTKALRADADERYASAEELEGDLGRYLDGLPVLARAPSLAYRATKFARRHRVPVALSFAVLLLLLSLALGGLVQAKRLSRQRDLARVEREKAEDVTRLFMEALEAADPGRSLGERLTVRDMLDRAAERVAREQDAEPEVQATMMHTIGSVYTGLGLYTEAIGQLSAALALRRSRGDGLVVADTLHQLGTAHLASGQPDRAEALLREALDLRRELLGEGDLETLSSLEELAAAHRAAGDFARAEGEYRLALARLEAVLGSPHSRVAAALNNLAGALEDRGEYDEAETSFRRSLAMHFELQGETSLDYAITLSNLAWLLKLDARLDEAEARSGRAVELLRQILGERHPDVATAMNNLALILLEQGRFGEAEEVLRRSLGLRRDALGNDHPLVAAGLDNLAWAILQGTGDYAAAEPLVREALDVRRRALGPGHPAVATSLNNVAALLLDRADGAAAEPFMRQALELQRQLYGPEHPVVAKSLANLSWAHLEQGDAAAAEEKLRQALAMRQRLFGDEHAEVAANLCDLAFFAERRGDHRQAEPLYRRALAMQRRLLGDGHPAVAHTEVRLSRLLTMLGDLEEAESMVGSAMRTYVASLTEGHWRHADAASVLGAVLLEQGRLADAESFLRSSHDTLVAARGPAIYESRWAAERLADLAEQGSHDVQGEASSARVASGRRSRGGP